MYDTSIHNNTPGGTMPLKKYVLNIQPSKTFHTKYGNVKRNDHDGYYRVTSRKEGNHFERWHKLIFEDFYGKIPNNCIIHHKDENKENNCVMNLQIMTQNNHCNCHNPLNIKNNTGYYRVQKWKNKSYTQGFVWVYQAKYKDKNGNKIREVITRANIEDLEREVKRRNLKWERISDDDV